MKVSSADLATIEKMVADIGGPEVETKAIKSYLNDENRRRIVRVLRKCATKAKFGAYVLDAALVKGLADGTIVEAPESDGDSEAPEPTVRQPTAKALARAARRAERHAKKAAAATKGAVEKVGKREKSQLMQLAEATSKTEIGEVMYEADLLKRGAVQITQEEARNLVKEGKMVYAIDRAFTAGIAVPPMAIDLTSKSTKVEFFSL